MVEDEAGVITVTRFELTAKPSIRVVPPAKQIALIRAMKPPTHFYRYLLSLLPETEVAHQRATWSDVAIADVIHDTNVAVYVLHADGVPAGMGELDFRQLPVTQIACAAVSGDYHDALLSRYLLAQIIALAWSRETERLIADITSRDARGTLSLYQACGFTVVEQHVAEPERPDTGEAEKQ